MQSVACRDRLALGEERRRKDECQGLGLSDTGCCQHCKTSRPAGQMRCVDGHKHGCASSDAEAPGRVRVFRGEVPARDGKGELSGMIKAMRNRCQRREKVKLKN